MREILIGEKTVRVRATPLALLYYRQEFKSDLVSDLIKLATGLVGMVPGIAGKSLNELSSESMKDIDFSNLGLADLASFNIDTIGLLRCVWAMSKADGYGTPFPCFEAWIVSLGDIDLFDVSFLQAIMEEMAAGFFRGGIQKQQKQKRKK